MLDPADYLAAIELALIESPVVTEYSVVRSWAHSDDGYIRVRAVLSNGDFLEAAEYFIRQDEELIPADYRHHWTDASNQQLRRRWDSTPDHPEIPNFPYHCHVESETNVVESEPMSLLQALSLIQNAIEPEKKSK